MKPDDRSKVTQGDVLPVAPSLASVRAPQTYAPIHRRDVAIAALAAALGVGAALLAEFLTSLIALITHIAYYGEFSWEPVTPWAHSLGWWAVLVPVVGALIVGVMARLGSAAIRGHGIPEVMEKVLHGRSEIPARLMFLKPLSAAIAIGTGGPFGAEGPIIATGGALGSVVGQGLRISTDERKTLLAAGAAAGMAATFGCPVSAVLLAVELLLFEYRARSVIPVALAASAATAVRIAVHGSAPMFAGPEFAAPGAEALTLYVVLGGLIGLVAVAITRCVYGIEDLFERLPLHWMWWPALGAIVVGVVGLFEPRTLGVGYQNIEQVLTGELASKALLALVVLKFVSWAIYLGSGTSGGTLAPLFTIGGGLGALAGEVAAKVMPSAAIDPRVAALVGMAAMFAGASHAMLASVVFAFETTRQPLGLLPILAGCAAAYLVATLTMRESIMTEKLARRGRSLRREYRVDFLEQVLARDVMSADVVTLAAGDTLAKVRAWIDAHTPGSSHQGFPVVDEHERLIGVVTRRDLLDKLHGDAQRVRELVRREASVAFEDNTLREAADHMLREGIGRLPVVARTDPQRVLGMLTRSDLLAAHTRRLDEAHRREATLRIAKPWAKNGDEKNGDE